MKIRIAFSFCFFFLFVYTGFGQNVNYSIKIDSLLKVVSTQPFNGIIFISEKGKQNYIRIQGYSNLETKKPLVLNDQFVIGSVSKQFTAVLVLQEVDKGHLNLFVPIKRYLPTLRQSWADTVTIHHLLTHTHGIEALDKSLLFKPGTGYAYSQLGYELLSKIIERSSGQSFEKLSMRLFEKCGMKNTFHPNVKKYKNLVCGYTAQENGALMFDTSSFVTYPAAGSFISTVEDLIIWNQQLHSGNILKEITYRSMVTEKENAIRQHPVFGVTKYGYGVTITRTEDIVQIGQTGFAPGFVSMNFYFPESETNVVVLGNIVYEAADLKKIFYFHTSVLEIIRAAKRKF